MASKITQRGAVAPVEALTTSTDIGLATMVGQRFDLSDGREVVLAQNAGTALVAGHLVAGPVSVANHTSLVVTAFSAATTSAKATVTVTLGGTAVLANEYQGGYLVVATSTGIGQTLKIDSHPAQATTTGNVVLTLGDNPAVALTTSSTVNLIKNPYGSANGTDYTTNGVVVCPTTASSRGEVIGACFYAIPASTATVASYGLLQTRGFVGLVNDAGTTKSVDIMPSTNTAGTVMTYAGTVQRVGTAVETGTTTVAGLCVIQL